MHKIRINIINGLLLLFSIFPIIPNKIKGLPVILLFIGAIFLYKKKKINWKWLLINSSLFIVYLFSVIYSNDYSESFKKLETALSILILPISFFILLPDFKITNSIKRIFIKFFIISTALFSIFCFFAIIFNDSLAKYKWETDRYRVIIMDMPVIGQHPIYASIFISIAIIFFIFVIKNNLINNISQKIIFSFLTILNSILLLVLLSKGVILSLFLVSLLCFARSKMIKFYKYSIMSFIVLSLLTLFIFNRRMNELINLETYTELNPNLSTSVRMGIYDCSLKIIKEELFLGYGIGDAQRALNLCYSNKSDMLLMNKYNSHNQYLDVVIKTGIVGLVTFLGFLFFNLKKGIKNKNLLLLMLIVFYGIIFMTENVLSRQSGVILFFFLISFFNKPYKSTEDAFYDLEVN